MTTFLLRSIAAVLIAALFSACSSTPPAQTTTNLTTSTPQRDEVSQLWALRAPRDTTSTAPTANKVLNLKLDRVPANQLLEILAKEYNTGYQLDECASNPISIYGKNLSFEALSATIAEQTGTTLTWQEQHILLRCDKPETRLYAIDYLALEREMLDTSSLSSGIGNPQFTLDTNQARKDSGNRSDLLLSNRQRHDFWADITAQLEQLIATTPKPIEISSREVIEDENGERAYNGESNDRTPGRKLGRKLESNALRQSTNSRRELVTRKKETRTGQVLVNSETGMIAVTTNSLGHSKVKQWLDAIEERLNRQIEVEAIITELNLNDQYLKGVDWNLLQTKGLDLGLSIQGLNSPAPAFRLTAGKNSEALQFSGVLKLLEEFGKASVLSSPRIVVMNQQAAVIKVIDNRVYFTTDVQTTAPTANNPAFSTFSTRVQTVPVGFLMTVTPSISESQSVQLRIRPTLSRIVGFVPDPNPSLKQLNIVSQIPEIQTREMESILRINQGEVALLGGLRQLEQSSNLRGIPGWSDDSKWLAGSESASNSNKELVILMRTRVVPRITLRSDIDAPNDFFASSAKQLRPGNTQQQRSRDGALEKELALALNDYLSGNAQLSRNHLLHTASAYPHAPEPVFNLALLNYREGLIDECKKLIFHLERTYQGSIEHLPITRLKSLTYTPHTQ